MNDLAQQWLSQSREDLATAKVLFDAERFGPCAFYCQQAAEKALMAAIYESGDKPLGHSLPSLLDQVCEVWHVDLFDAPSTEVEALDEDALFWKVECSDFDCQVSMKCCGLCHGRRFEGDAGGYLRKLRETIHDKPLRLSRGACAFCGSVASFPSKRERASKIETLVSIS